MSSSGTRQVRHDLELIYGAGKLDQRLDGAETWGAAAGELAVIGRVIVYDRRGYERSGRRSSSVITVDTSSGPTTSP